MSREEKIIFIEKLRTAVKSYQGFTQREKSYADKHLPNWIGAKGELDTFIQKFSEQSIDIQPFLVEKKFMQHSA
jgi:hypothetical protein